IKRNNTIDQDHRDPVHIARASPPPSSPANGGARRFGFYHPLNTRTHTTREASPLQRFVSLVGNPRHLRLSSSLLRVSRPATRTTDDQDSPSVSGVGAARRLHQVSPLS
ncbi:hypothetical protein GW17_00049463, partial [Ensete ventricosum]